MAQPQIGPDEDETAGKAHSARRLRLRLRDALAAVAPSIAGALGGPLAGAAVGALARKVLGVEGAAPGDEAALERAVQAADPETREKIADAEREFSRAVLDARTQALRIAADDRADARAREEALKDWTPSVIGVAVILGFFGVLIAMLTRTLPQGAQTEFSIMLGALATMTAAVVNYFFGSSAGSREKTWLMTGRGGGAPK